MHCRFKAHSNQKMFTHRHLNQYVWFLIIQSLHQLCLLMHTTIVVHVTKIQISCSTIVFVVSCRKKFKHWMYCSKAFAWWAASKAHRDLLWGLPERYLFSFGPVTNIPEKRQLCHDIGQCSNYHQRKRLRHFHLSTATYTVFISISFQFSVLYTYWGKSFWLPVFYTFWKKHCRH